MSHTNNGETFLGELDRARTERLETIRGLFDEAGLNPVLVDDVIATIWAKFVHNCGINALCAITGLRPGEIHEVPSLDEFQTGIIEETVALVRAKGIVCRMRPAVHDQRILRAQISPALDDAASRPRTDSPKSIRLNGYVARESARLGMAAPCNDALTRIMHGRQHRRSRFEEQPMSLSGRSALITGAGRGIGKTHRRACSARTAWPWPSTTSIPVRGKHRRRTASGGASRAGVPGTMTSAAAAVADDVRSRRSRNSGPCGCWSTMPVSTTRRPIEIFPKSEWDREFAVDCKAVFLCSQAAVRRMTPRRRRPYRGGVVHCRSDRSHATDRVLLG